MTIRLLAAALGICLWSASLSIPPVHAAAPPKVSVSLISESAAVQPGGSVWVGLRQRIAPGWHTYWLNPGDSGEAPTIEWALPAGFEAGPIVWPQPELLPVAPLMSYGYTREVVLLTRLTAPADLPIGAPVTLRGRASWLVCEKTCIPEEADIALTLPVSAAKPPAAATAPVIEQARRAVPVPSPWTTSLRATQETVTLAVAAPGLAADRIAEVRFFPSRWGVIDHATNTPHMYVVDRAGLLVYAGAIDDRPTSRRADVQGANNYVRAALDAVAAGQPVKTPVTRAYGCTVKYS